jgi:hypothetical protein
MAVGLHGLKSGSEEACRGCDDADSGLQAHILGYGLQRRVILSAVELSVQLH